MNNRIDPDIVKILDRFCLDCCDVAADLMLELARGLESSDLPQDGLVARARQRLEERIERRAN